MNSTMGLGGVPRVISIWSKHLIKNGYVVEAISNDNVSSFYSLPKGMFHKKLGIDKFVKKNKISAFFKYLAFFRNKKNHIFILNKSFYLVYVYILKLFGFIHRSNKIIYYIHGSSSNLKFHYNNFKKFLIHNVSDKIIVLIHNYNDHYINSKKSIIFNLCSLLIPNFSNQIMNKMEVIPNPLFFNNNNKPIKDENILLALGRLDRIKGFDVLLKAWDKIEVENNAWKLIIVGDGEEKSKLLDYIKKRNLKRIELIPASDDILGYYEKASIFINTSKEEGFGMPMLEAMACFTPVIAFQNAGSKFLIKNEYNGYLCENGNISELILRIKDLMMNKRKRLTFGQNAKFYSDQFSSDNLYLKIEKLIKSL